MSLVLIEHVAPPERVRAGESAWVRFVVTRPADAAGAVVLPAGGVRGRSVTVSTDLFTQDVKLNPGEAVTLTVGVRFDQPRPADLSELTVQVNPAVGDNEIVRLPARPFRVVPSLDRVAVGVERVCGYDDAVKVEVAVTNTSADPFTDVEVGVGPADAVRAGPLRRCLPALAPGHAERFELVLTSPAVEFTLSATAGGERAEERRRFDVPAEGGGRADAPPFTFLEPRMLTTDRVQLVPQGQSAPLVPAGGVVPVRGGKARYQLLIEPSHPQAGRVRVYPAPGSVEVEEVAPVGQGVAVRADGGGEPDCHPGGAAGLRRAGEGDRPAGGNLPVHPADAGEDVDAGRHRRSRPYPERSGGGVRLPGEAGRHTHRPSQR